MSKWFLKPKYSFLELLFQVPWNKFLSKLLSIWLKKKKMQAATTTDEHYIICLSNEDKILGNR